MLRWGRVVIVLGAIALLGWGVKVGNAIAVNLLPFVVVIAVLALIVSLRGTDRSGR